MHSIRSLPCCWLCLRNPIVAETDRWIDDNYREPNEIHKSTLTSRMKASLTSPSKELELHHILKNAFLPSQPQIPPTIRHYTHLKRLMLGGNNLTSTPEGLFELTNLVYLSLSDNQLTTLSPRVSNLRKLKTLFLSTNRITALPEEIGSLDNLRAVWLSNQDLQDEETLSLPDSITNLQECSFNLPRQKLVSSDTQSLLERNGLSYDYDRV